MAARDVAQLVDLLDGAGVDRAAMCRALTAVRKMDEVIAFANHWAFRAELPAHPVPQGDCYFPIERASDLKRLAHTYRNCLKSMLANALEGRSAFAVIRNEEEEAVVHLVHHQKVWQLLEVCGHNNVRPSATLFAKAAVYLKSRGIEKRSRFSSTKSLWQPLRRLLGREFLQMEMDEILL